MHQDWVGLRVEECSGQHTPTCLGTKAKRMDSFLTHLENIYLSMFGENFNVLLLTGIVKSTFKGEQCTKFNFACVSVWPLCKHTTCAEPTRGQKRAGHPLELRLQAVVSLHVGPGIQSGFSAKQAHALKC